MSPFYIILFILLLGVLLGAYVLFFSAFLAVEQKLNSVLDWFASPFKKISSRFFLPKHRNIVMFGVALLAVGYVLYALVTAANVREWYMTIFMGTSMGAVADLLTNGFDLQGQIGYASLVAVAFGSFLSYVYMKFTISNLGTLELHKAVHGVLFVLLNVLFIAFSSLLTEHLTVMFSKAADMIYNVYLRLSGRVSHAEVNRFWDAFPLIGCYALVIPILLAAFLTTVITVREYLANLFYGLASLLILIAVGLLITWIASKLTGFPVIVSDICIFLSMFIVDYIRAHDGANQWFRGCIKSLADGVMDILLALFPG